MTGQLLAIADFKTTDLLGAAGATTGLMIAGTLFLQFLSAKYIGLYARYIQLTDEYRNGKNEEPRHGSVCAEIRIYRERLWLLSWGNWLAGLALLCLIVAVLSGGCSMAFPEELAFKWSATVSLGLGLVLIGAGVAIQIWESVLARHEIRREIADLDDPVKQSSC
jgi:hypothetical protein